MDKQLLIQQKQSLASMEAKEKKLAVEFLVKKKARTIGRLITIVGLLLILSITVLHEFYDHFNIIVLLLGAIGIVVGLTFWVKSKRDVSRLSKEIDGITSGIEEAKLKLIEIENS